MQNLKKVLSLALVLAMAFSLMAGAAEYTDADTIINKTAVNIMSALNIIKGYTDGSFQGEKIVTRAEMAKMIYVIKNGGVDDGATYYTGFSTPLTDINGHWAEGYIKYCYTQGIIAGKGFNRFWPDESVTGLEAAKMALVIMGYNAERAALVGNQWALRTASLATDAGLFESFNIPFANACPRDYAALLLFNTIEADTVIFNSDYGDYTKVQQGTQTGINETVGFKYLKLQDVRGTLDGSGNAGWNSAGANTLHITYSNGTVSFKKVTTDYTALLGQRVRALFKINNDNELVLYGVFSTTDNYVKEVQLSKIDKITADASQITIDRVTYKLARNASTMGAFTANSSDFAPFYDGTNVSLLAKDYQKWAPSSTVRLISNDGDQKFDIAVVTPVFVGKVANASNSSFSTSSTATQARLSGIAFDNEDYVIYDGLKKDDIVRVTPDGYSFDEKTHIEKVELIEGKIDGLRTDNSIKIGDTWYSRTAISGTEFDNIATGDTVKIAAIGGYYYFLDKVLSATKDLVYLAGFGSRGSGGGYINANVVFTKDGANQTIQVDKFEGGADVFPSDFTTGNNPASADYVDKLYIYSVSGSQYTLEPATAANTGFDNFSNTGSWSRAASDKDARIGNQLIADDAVVILKYGYDANADQYNLKVYTGAAVKKWAMGSFGANGASGPYLSTTASGINYVQVAVLTTAAGKPSGSGDLKVAYVTATPYQQKIDGTMYMTYPVWNGKENVELVHETTGVTPIVARGYAMSYRAVAGNEINDIVKLTVGAIEGYNDTSIKFVNENLAETKDTTFMYVQTDNSKTGGRKGFETGSIAIADKVTGANSTYIKNAAYCFDGADLVAVVIDVNNIWFGEGNIIAGGNNEGNALLENVNTNDTMYPTVSTVHLNQGVVASYNDSTNTLTYTGHLAYSTGYSQYFGGGAAADPFRDGNFIAYALPANVFDAAQAYVTVRTFKDGNNTITREKAFSVGQLVTGESFFMRVGPSIDTEDALGVPVAKGVLQKVEFYVDDNANGALDAGETTVVFTVNVSALSLAAN